MIKRIVKWLFGTRCNYCGGQMVLTTKTSRRREWDCWGCGQHVTKYTWRIWFT